MLFLTLIQCKKLLYILKKFNKQYRISDCRSKHPCNLNPCHQEADCFIKDNNNNTIINGENNDENNKMLIGESFSSYCKCDKCHTGITLKAFIKDYTY